MTDPFDLVQGELAAGTSAQQTWKNSRGDRQIMYDDCTIWRHEPSLELVGGI
ncbi:hypothetical protein [Pseudooceanicola atlanticus]|uniref:hypothetical protein n=1 Tax=Pseudooceanicola atlanticus TaxID=1461694 RepID=UPI0012E03F84|nr:hypothetical protein [Pseudooceanicola atlanticus]